VQSYDNPLFDTSGRGVVEVVFKTSVRGCTAVATGVGYTGSDVSIHEIGLPDPNAVRVGMTSVAGGTPPFELVVVCDPRDAPPTEIVVARPVPSGQ
jgi:hypothetical protein